MKNTEKSNNNIDKLMSDKAKEKEQLQWSEPFSKEDLDKWKKEYGKVFKSYAGDDVYIWKKLNRKEYSDIMNIKCETQEETLDERRAAIVKAVLLYPNNTESVIEENGYLAATLSDYIVDKSGFVIGEPKEL